MSGIYDDYSISTYNAKIENVKYIKDNGNGDKFLSDNGKHYSIDNNMILSTHYMYDKEWIVDGNYERLLNVDGSGFFRTNSNTVKMIPNANDKPKILNTTRLTSQIRVYFQMKSREYSYIVDTLGLDHAIFKIKLINAKNKSIVSSVIIRPEDFKAWDGEKWVNIFNGTWQRMSALLYMSGLEGYENDLYLEFEPIITDTNYTIDISDIQVTPVNVDEDTIRSGGNISEMLERTYRYADESITNTINDEVNQSNWIETDTTKFSYIKNKPNLSTVATSGNYNDLSNKPNYVVETIDEMNALVGVKDGDTCVVSKHVVKRLLKVGDNLKDKTIYFDNNITKINTPSYAVVDCIELSDLDNPTYSCYINGVWNSMGATTGIYRYSYNGSVLNTILTYTNSTLDSNTGNYYSTNFTFLIDHIDIANNVIVTEINENSLMYNNSIYILDEQVKEYRYKNGQWIDITNVKWSNVLDKPTTISGYGITDAYTKDWIDNNCIELVDGYVKDTILFNTSESYKGIVWKDPSNTTQYSSLLGTYSGMFFNMIGSGISNSFSVNKYGVEITAQTDTGVMLYNHTKLTFGLSSNENEHFEALKLSSIVLSEAELQIGDSRIPSKFSSTVKMPRLNILNNSNVYEGALWNSTYDIDGTVHDGLHLTHEPNKYLVLGYKKETDGVYYSYIIMDQYEVLKKEGEDWSPIRFEQEAVFRRGLKIGTFFDIQIGGYNLKEKISSLENAITTGTGMVQWSNVLSKPTTISGYGITDALSKTGGVLTGALQILSNDLDGKYNGLLVGNDCYIGDCNYTDTIGIMGVTNNNVGYIKFGKLGGQLGFNGTNLVYNGTNVSLYGHTHLYDETLAFVNTPSGTTGASWGYDVPSYNTAIINKGTCMSVLNSKLVFTSPTTGVFQLQGTVVISASGVSFYYYVDGTLTGQLYKSSGNTEVASFNTTVKLNAGQKVTFFFGSGIASNVNLDQLVVKRLNY